MLEIWAGVRIQLINVLQVVLSVASTNNVEFGVDEGHRVASSHFRILLYVCKIVAVGPPRRRWVKCVQVVEALRVGTGATEKVQVLPNFAEGHAGTWRWRLT